MPSGWLSDQIRAEDPGWDPVFARRSAFNWAKAVSFEISEEHGTSATDQFQSSNDLFSRTVETRRDSPSNAKVFGPLFHSLTFSTTLSSLSLRRAKSPWMNAVAVVAWYYAIYNATRSMLAAMDDREHNRHRAVIKSFNELQERMPHPFNMVATHSSGENYSSSIPTYTSTTPYDLSRNFEPDRDKARGMLLQYVGGTAKHEVDEVKASLRRERGITSFLTNDAKAARDQRLPAKVNFLSCAYRSRGKANYRDSLFFAYGRDRSQLEEEFIDTLRDSSQFFVTCALAYSKRRVGESAFSEFITDARSSFRGQDSANPGELFWMSL